MRRHSNLAALAGLGAFIAVGAMVAAACSSTTSTKSGNGANPTSPAAATQAFVVSTTHTRLGTVLVDRAGHTLYSFSADHGAALACNGPACLSEWPPYEVAAGTALTAGPGLHGKLGTVMRADGKEQVTYSGLALYTFSGDQAAGQVGGQGLAESFNGMRGVWKAVGPTSAMATASAAPTTAKPVATTGAPTTSPAPAATQPATTMAPASTMAPGTTSPPTTKAPATTQPPTTPPPTSPPTTAPSWA